MNVDLLDLLFFFQVAVALLDTAMGFLPVLGAIFVAAGVLKYTFEGFDALTHAGVECLFDSVQVVVHESAEVDEEVQRLVNVLVLKVEMLGQLYNTNCNTHTSHLLKEMKLFE